MPKAKKTTEHLELAEALESWAKRHQVATDPYVVRLADSLRTRRDLAMWASLNPMEFLPNPEVHKMRSAETIAHFLAVVRNSIVFLPVALTWIAVSKATTAFALYTSKNSIAVVNFLEFWQNGYGVLAKEWTIGRVAFIDFALILVVIFLTLLTAYLGRRNQNLRQNASATLDAERTTLALDISAYLFSKQSVTPLTMTASMATSLRQLLNATDALDKSTSTLEKKFKELPTNRELLLEIKAIKNELFKKQK
ncbi:A_NRPS domain containing protein [Candidatus Nanopelagicaceae bacterium]|jgi:hypothetical protein